MSPYSQIRLLRGPPGPKGDMGPAGLDARGTMGPPGLDVSQQIQLFVEETMRSFLEPFSRACLARRYAAIREVSIHKNA